MDENSRQIREAGNIRKKNNKALLERLKRNTPPNLDVTMQEIHEEVFQETDCLSCANCCKTTSPVFTPKDIDRISSNLRIRPKVMIERYLRIDEDGDYVLLKSPCAFLLPDNRCAVYDDRPTACRTYPHTNRKRFIQLADLTYRNSFICPAVQSILEKLRNLTS